MKFQIIVSKFRRQSDWTSSGMKSDQIDLICRIEEEEADVRSVQTRSSCRTMRWGHLFSAKARYDSTCHLDWVLLPLFHHKPPPCWRNSPRLNTVKRWKTN
ncbi:unnamed protein product [Urochloa humidicola]